MALGTRVSAENEGRLAREVNARTVSFPRPHEDQVMHVWVADNVAAQTLLELTIRSGLALVLTLMFCPRVHQEYLQITVPGLHVVKDSPARGAIAPPDAFIFM